MLSKVPQDPITHYVIVRADLPRGFQAAQIVHAAGYSASPDLPSDAFAVVLSTASECELVSLSRRLTVHGIEHVLVTEIDSPYCGAATAIGVRPRRKGELKRYLRDLRKLE